MSSTPTSLPPPPALGTLRAEGPIALFLDFDGTLVDLAATPDTIVVPKRLATRLGEVAASLDGALALVSGRAIVDLEGHVGELSIARAGSHGIDRRQADGRPLGAEPEPLSTRVHDVLRSFALEFGFRLEPKPHGGALHYRENPAAESTGLAFARTVAAEHGLVVKTGKFVIELVQPGADKGGAVRAFMQEPPFAGRRPIFVGDDVTDEDGMRAAAELGGLGIAVGERETTAARYRLPSPAAVLDWLGL
jgi:trehalose 6-phosphate phosphatase